MAYEYGAELQTSRLHNCMTQYCFAHVQAGVAWKEQIRICQQLLWLATKCPFPGVKRRLSYHLFHFSTTLSLTVPGNKMFSLETLCSLHYFGSRSKWKHCSSVEAQNVNCAEFSKWETTWGAQYSTKGNCDGLSPPILLFWQQSQRAGHISCLFSGWIFSVSHLLSSFIEWFELYTCL